MRRLVAANAAAAAASAGGDVDSVCVLCVLLYLCVYLIDIAPHGTAARVSVCAKSYLWATQYVCVCMCVLLLCSCLCARACVYAYLCYPCAQLSKAKCPTLDSTRYFCRSSAVAPASSASYPLGYFSLAFANSKLGNFSTCAPAQPATIRATTARAKNISRPRATSHSHCCWGWLCCLFVLLQQSFCFCLYT